MAEAVCIGISVCDLLFGSVSPALFDRELTLAERFDFSVGGDAVNQAVRISMLGHGAALLSQVGDDVFGRYILEQAASHGVDTGGVRVDERHPTTVTAVLVKEDGQRHFISTRGASKYFDREGVDFDAVRSARAVSVASAFHAHGMDACAEEILREAKAAGALTFMDFIGADDGGALRDLARAFRYLDYAMPNYDEAAALTGERDLDRIASAYRELGVRRLIVKLGAGGCFFTEDDKRLLVPGFKVRCVDTTGAGDNFAGGFIAAKLEGKPDRDALVYANAVGALAVQSYGAQAEIRRSDVLALAGGIGSAGPEDGEDRA